MVVEDEFITAEHLRRSIQGFGYDVCAVASSADEALKKARKFLPDLVLMDIILKGGADGIEAAHCLRSQLDVPVIFITAYANKEMLERAKQAEPYGYILKPFQIKELQTAIEMAIYRHRKEAKRREDEQWYVATLNTIEEAVIAINARDEIIFLNRAAETLTGWENGTAFGQRLSTVVGLSGCEKNVPQLSACLVEAAKKSANRVLVTLKKKPEKIVELRPVVVKDPFDRAQILVMVLRETEKTGTREAIAPSCFIDAEGVIDSLENMALIIGAGYRIEKINSLLAERRGVCEEEIIGTPCYSLIHNSTAPCHGCAHVQVLSDQRPHTTARMSCAGLEGSFSIVSIPLVGARGSVQGSVTLLRESAEDELKDDSLTQLLNDLKRFAL